MGKRKGGLPWLVSDDLWERVVPLLPARRRRARHPGRAITLTGGNRHDVTQLLPLLDAIPRIRGHTGRPRHRPRQLFADCGYDFDEYRRLLWKRGIKAVIARRGAAHGSGLGVVRWVVERTNAWIHGFRRLRIRWEIRDDIHEAFLKLACCVITFRRVRALGQLS